MNLSIIGCAGVPAKYGGFETLVDHLCQSKIPDSMNVEVFCSSKGLLKDEMIDKYYGVKLKYVNLSANGVSSVVYDLFSMLKAKKGSTLLILGVSGCVFLPIIKPFFRKIVVNIDGVEWKRQKWGRIQKTFLRLSEMIAIYFADVVIADNNGIADHVKTISNSSKVEIIEYGADHVISHGDDSYVRNNILFGNQNYWVSVCRIEPENNTDMILDAFDGSDENLVFVGNWKRSEYGKKLFLKYSDKPNMELLDPIYDQEQIDSIRRNAKGYIHGHSAGGTNPSLVEAMALELPILCFDVSYNRFTTNGEAAYFITKEDISQYITSVSLETLREMSRLMKVYADSNYTWDKIASKYWSVL